MSDFSQGAFGTELASPAAERNKVMRNTYALLGLSMIPTVLGAWVGVSTGAYHALTGITGMLIFFAVAFGFMFAIQKTKDSAAGVGFLLGFTFFMGLMLSGLISSILGLRNGTSLIMTAFGGTAGVFLGMSVLATVIKRELSGFAKFLSIGALVLMVGSIIAALTGSSAGMLAVSFAAIAIFSGFLVVDLKRIIDGGETNYITATLSLYLSLYNIFQSMLVLLGVFGGERD
jgi:modulator of FtsH protease